MARVREKQSFVENQNVRTNERQIRGLEREEIFSCLGCQKQLQAIIPAGLNLADLKIYCSTCQQKGKGKWTCEVCHEQSEKVHEH